MDSDHISRRTFLKGMAAGTLSLGFSVQENSNTALDARDVVAARHKSRQRKRRIIMNNDGNDLRQFKDGEPVTPENFLSKRTSALVGSHVDAIFYCTGVFNLYKHNTKEGELHLRNDGEGDRVQALIDQCTDILEIMTKFGHEHDMEVFWSMRMNDTHDSRNPVLFCEWKAEHPEYLVGQKDKKLPYGCNRWSSVDYGVPAVRDKVFRIFEDVCTRYDIDGIEMDFFRHLGAYVVVMAVLAIINNVTSPGYQWWLWPALGWGIGIVFHFMSIFVFAGGKLEKRLVDKELEKMDEDKE